jgi:glycosyltransferase involved in cell wall biosynthesis
MSTSCISSPVAFEFFNSSSAAQAPVPARARPWPPEAAAASRPLIAICHLGWDWVWQRPQQFLSRLSQTHPVLFVETHCTPTPVSYTRSRSALNHPSVTILEIHLPADHWSDGCYIDTERRRLLQDRLKDEFQGRYDHAILWFNDPMAVTAYAGHLGESVVVYDCMDELSQFHGAPPALIERELQLTRRADVIFCGGRKMREKRLPLNPNTHFYGTGVDCDHFGKALSDDLAVDPDIAALPGPVLGYFGVIDERIDYALVAALADANPEWSIAMVGPFAKVDPAALPRRPNLHWLGGRPYGRLPAITKGFSVCLMPFALNAATEYINPTKALEYMATGRPVVSTALNEVRSNFSSIARIAGGTSEFIELCRKEVRSPSRLRIQRGLRLASDNTWETIAAKMDGHIRDFFTRQTSSSSAVSAPAAATTPSSAVLSGQRPAYV